jgi:hypothetical protein
MSPQDLAAFTEAVEAPLSPADQAVKAFMRLRF